MKKALHKITSLLMALMLLLSTVSWTIEKHTCMGRVMDVALFAKADDCGMAAAMQAMEDDAFENHCCGEETHTLLGQDDLTISFNDLSLYQQVLLVTFSHDYVELFASAEDKTGANDCYPPPLLVKDIQLLDETFLI